MFMNKPRKCNFVWEVISQKCGHTDRKIEEALNFVTCRVKGVMWSLRPSKPWALNYFLDVKMSGGGQVNNTDA